MSGSFLSLGILNPWGFLLALPILGAMVYAYLRKQKLVEKVIPSLFLLRDLAQPVSTRRKFAPPPRFWFELLLLTLLLLCLVGIFHRSETDRYAVILDNSLSSAAVIGQGTVMDLLKDQVRDAVRELPGDVVFDLYSASPQIERVGGTDLGKAALIEALSRIAPVYARDNFNDHIPQVLQRGQYNRVIVFSDRQLEFNADAAAMRKLVSIRPLQLPASDALQNVMLDSVSYERATADQENGKLSFSVSAFTQGPVTISVVLERTDGKIDAPVWKQIGTQRISLANAETKSGTFSLAGGTLDGVRVRIDRSGLTDTVNALKEDDVLYLSFKRENRLVYVVSARSLQELGVEKIKGIKFKSLTPEGFQEAVLKDEAATFLLVDFMPNGLPDRNLIIISPPNGAGGFEAGNVVQGAELTGWKGGHPLLTYIDTATIRLSRFVPLEAPLWGEAIISTNRGTAMFAGDRGVRRVVVAGFDLFPYRGRISPTISVLFLNMLRWVSADPLGERPLSPYEPLSFPGEVSRIVSIAGESHPESFERADQRSLFVPTSPGLYLGLDSELILSAHAVNFSSMHESDLASRQETLEAVTVPATPEKLERQKDLSELLIPLLLVMVFLDLCYLLIRVFRPQFKVSRPVQRGKVAA